MLRKAGPWLLGRVGELLYTLVVLVACLWLLFPGKTARDLLVRSLNAALPQLQWRVGTIGFGLPGELRLDGIEGREAGGEAALLRIDRLQVRPDLAALVRERRLRATFLLEVAGGTVRGRLGPAPQGAEVQVEGTVQGVRLADLALLERRLQRGLQGTAAAEFTAAIRRSPLALSALSATARVDNGRVGLKQPVLGHTFVPFARAAASLRLRDGRLELTEGSVDSNLFAGTFSGDLRPRPDLAASPITLSGSLQPRSEFFSAAGVSPGALAEVRSRLRDRPLPFRVSGNLGNPGIHFEEFSMLFDTLSKESRSP